jgi:D-sedoheptulose 7-phosphate isomerase
VNCQLGFFLDYAQRVQAVLQSSDWSGVERLAGELLDCWRTGRQVFLCGNGGSAGNAIHLANEVGYESIFRYSSRCRQIGDVLIALSGSGNSPNIVKALEQAKAMGMRTYAILGYSGGKAKTLANVPVLFPVDDMQISEDMQLVVGHMIMQWLYSHQPARA